MPQLEVELQTVWLYPVNQCQKKSKGTLHGKTQAVNSAIFLRACNKTSAHVQFDHTGKNYHKSAIFKGSLTRQARKF